MNGKIFLPSEIILEPQTVETSNPYIFYFHHDIHKMSILLTFS